ncbi:GH3 family domain-containing protein [Lichenicoccus sp.]|uniref:GH3 family domain-containing protein n=1 Tax=Lichenicoccus sp. TaxID=2781899 RepID=UPI003D0D1317
MKPFFRPEGLDATPLLRAFAERRLRTLGRQDPLRAQRQTLRSLLRRAAQTRFGLDHGFARISSVRDYQALVPLRTYEDFWRDYFAPSFPTLRDVTWSGRIPAFALTSGTTSATSKYIPVSAAMARSNIGAGFDTLAFHLANRSHSRLFGGRNCLLGGSTALLRLAPGVVAGDLSGIAAARMPLWAGPRAFPPRALALTRDWEAKIAALAPASLAHDIRSLSGTPSWMLLFFAQLAALHPQRPRRLAAFYPNLELVVHGGVSLTPYRDALTEWLEGSHAETREVYAASEGFIAIADRGPGDGMRLVTDRGLFFEFVEPKTLDAANPPRFWLADAKIGVNYALVLSTNAGLWSCIVGDTVMLTERNPPRLLITGRIAATLNVFGEHLVADELDRAVTESARAFGASVSDYTAGPHFPPEAQPRGGHLFVVELARQQPDQQAFARVLDQALARMNADYADHRRGNFGMLPPTVCLVATGRFTAWMREQGRLGGQNKVPRVINDPDRFAALQLFMGCVIEPQ